MRIVTLCVALATLAGMTANASAASKAPQGGFKDEPVPEQVFCWTGFYLGANVGGGWGNTDWTVYSTPNAYSQADVSGWVLGAQAGYNWQLDPGWVLGAEGSLSWADIGGSATESPTPDWTDHTRVNWLGDISGRLGVAVLSRTLAFAKAGVVWGNFDHSTVDAQDSTLSEWSDPDDRIGWLIGAGVETAFSPQWSVKIEYNWLDFADSKFTLVDQLSQTIPAKAEHDVSIVKVGVNYRFAAQAYAPLK